MPGRTTAAPKQNAPKGRTGRRVGGAALEARGFALRPAQRPATVRGVTPLSLDFHQNPKARPVQLPPFKNEPFTDFTNDAERSAFEAALKKVRSEFGQTWPCFIGGEEVTSKTTMESRDPGDLDMLVAKVPKLGREEADRAVEAATAAFPTWSQTPAEERAKYLVEASRLIRERKHEFSAWMVHEVGKSWAEADGDTAEAIDFLEYYARQAIEVAKPQPVTPVEGEKNELRYIALGVAAIIPPWNFPLAIMAGMATAALVTGNTVVLKPAEQSPGIAAKFVALMHEVGLPKEVLQFVTGPGEEVGDAMVVHPKTRSINFTGSRQVGLLLHKKSAEVAEGQVWMKRYVAEMGGKDGILVDADADVDSAVEGVLKSAYGFQGQKCSACSRAMVHEAVYDEFIAKLTPRVRELQQGHPKDVANAVGPVIDDEARDKVLEYIGYGKKEGKLAVGGKQTEDNGYYIQPTLFVDVPHNARVSREEIFGPVLAVMKVASWEEGIEVANNTDYGLTGAIYSNNRAHIDDAKRRFHVGNFYVNRGCTGALVGAHPFGGFKMSGTDSKAGGPDYLLHFVQAKLMSEKI